MEANGGAAATTPSVSSVHLTLPLSCQVCLGKVKDPVICTNQHVFCANCMSQWLEISKSNMCPTCRVPVTDKQPCKRIIGSMEVSPTIKDKTLKEQMRRTRFEILFQEFENEIRTLEQRLEEFQAENRHIKEINIDLKMRLDSAESKFLNGPKEAQQENKNGDAVPQDIGTILKLSTRLQDMINFNNELKEENKTLKKQLQDVIRKNENMKEEMDKLSNANNYNMSPRKFSRYTVAALETKVDLYDREIKRLKRALERSDEYMEELKQQQSYYSRLFHNNDDMPARMSELSHANDQGALEGNFPSRNRSPANIASTVSNIQGSKIDELASVALATRGSFFDPSSNHAMGGNSPAQSKSIYNVAQCDDNRAINGSCTAVNPNLSAGLETPVSSNSTTRSIFEDPSKFPACAKLIELTKVRRDLTEMQPAEVLPLDSPEDFVDNRRSSMISSANVGNSIEGSVAEITAVERSPSSSFSSMGQHQNGTSVAVSNTYSKSTQSSPGRAFSAAGDNQHEFHGHFRESPPSQTTHLSPHDPHLKTYPSSVFLQNDESNHNIHKNDGEDFVAKKRIKVEEPE